VVPPGRFESTLASLSSHQSDPLTGIGYFTDTRNRNSSLLPPIFQPTLLAGSEQQLVVFASGQRDIEGRTVSKTLPSHHARVNRKSAFLDAGTNSAG